MAGLGDGWRPASMRFNNPGAMNYGPFASRRGARQAGRFAQFDTPEAGWAAMDDLLGSYRQRGLNTPSSVIGRWAPRNVDNNSTDQYTATVARRLGIGPNDTIPDSAWPQLAEAMASYEAGRPNPRPGARAPAAPLGAPFGGAPPGMLQPPMGLGGPQPAETPPAMPPMGAFMPPLPQAGAAPPAAPSMPPMSDFMPPLPAPPPASPEGPASMAAGDGTRSAPPVPLGGFRSGPDLASNFMPASPAPQVPPFGAPEVEREPQLDALGSPFGASGQQQPGIGLTAGINQATGGPPQAPPVDADAIMRGAQGAADARTPQARPFSMNDLASNPLFMAGLSILGTAPGGNWGPNGAQAMAAATRGQREQTEYQRLQQQRSTMDRVWAEAFPNGQPSAQHPLLQGMPPEMASTIFAMGPEEGLPLAQRWQMFRGQQSEQLRTMQARADIAEGRQPAQAPAAPPVGSNLIGASGVLPTGDQLEGLAASQPGPQAAASAPQAGAGEPTISFAGETMTLGQAQARARRLDALGMRSELLEKTIEKAISSQQAPSGFRWAAGGQLEPIPGGPGEHIAGEQAGRLASMQTARTHFAQARQYLTQNLGVGDAVGHAIGGSMLAPQYDQARRTVRLAIEGALRANTGAAAPTAEVDSYMDMFMPKATDPTAVRSQKLNLLSSFMDNIQETITRGRRPAGGTAPAGASRVRTYNPQTGELE